MYMRLTSISCWLDRAASQLLDAGQRYAAAHPEIFCSGNLQLVDTADTARETEHSWVGTALQKLRQSCCGLQGVQLLFASIAALPRVLSMQSFLYLGLQSNTDMRSRSESCPYGKAQRKPEGYRPSVLRLWPQKTRTYNNDRIARILRYLHELQKTPFVLYDSLQSTWKPWRNSDKTSHDCTGTRQISECNWGKLHFNVFPTGPSPYCLLYSKV